MRRLMPIGWAVLLVFTAFVSTGPFGAGGTAASDEGDSPDTSYEQELGSGTSGGGSSGVSTGDPDDPQINKARSSSRTTGWRYASPLNATRGAGTFGPVRSSGIWTAREWIVAWRSFYLRF